ncbi:MAG TPA: hypothetical protein VNO81_03450 [Candidatus Nitrosotenuis sp.]|nr:hypothetical protein [Candidatus Nitrosotenuis sp.]
MSEILGLGPGQPVRPATPGLHVSPARPVEKTENVAGFGSDAVSVSGTPVEAAATPPEAPPAAASEVPRAQAPVVPDKPLVEDIGGFYLAGTGRPSADLTPGAGIGTNPTGPIAMIDEPLAGPAVSYPELDLNGPGSAHLGLWSLSGKRLA